MFLFKRIVFKKKAVTPSGECSDWNKHAQEPPIMVTCGSVHCTSATDQLKMHYTPQVAKLVEEWYKDDFEVLNYPKWDGEGKFELPVDV